MRKKMALVLAAGLVASMGVPAAAEQTEGYLYGTLDVSYADFYYGEVMKVEPESPLAEAGQYEASDAVLEAGLMEEGMYDAVTSATNNKSLRFASTYAEETEDGGANILGVAGVNVAISKSLYEDVQAAITEGKACSNRLVELVSALGEMTEEAPAEYKVILSDGTLSKTIGNTVTLEELHAAKEEESSAAEGEEAQAPEEIGAEIVTKSSWGNYQINISGLEVDSAVLQGGLLETEDGTIYGLEHLDNLWLRPEECAYTISDAVINRASVPADALSMGEGVVTLGAACKPGQYQLVFSDETYADLVANVMVESGLEEGSITVTDGVLTVAENEMGLSVADYLAAVSSVTVNGNPVGGRNLGSVIFTEDGSVNLEATVSNHGEETVVFEGSDSYEVVLQASGYPEVTFTVAAE